MPPVIDLKTAIPGPKSQALNARRAKAVPRGVPFNYAACRGPRRERRF